jgi:hypothetical protein
MDELRLRTRTVSEIVDAAFALYRRDGAQYIAIMAVATLPQLLGQLILRPGGPGATVASLIMGMVSLLISALTYAIGTAAIMKFGSAAYLGEPLDLGGAVAAVVPKLGSIILAGILKAILYVIGFFVFFVGELYVAARFFAVGAAIVLEDADAGEAFSRSSALSSGRKRHILNTMLLVWIIYGILSIGLSVMVGIAKSQVLALVVTSAFTIAAYPVVALTNMVLYYDCRIRGEGFDIERMAASLGRAGGAPGVAGAST